MKRFGQDNVRNYNIGALTPGVRGDDILASQAGIVSFAGVPERSLTGSPYIIIQGFDGRQYSYVHEYRAHNIGQGSIVYTGDFLGLMSDLGSQDEVHLHFEIRIDGNPSDPLKLLR